jgi:hypothetical protein
VSVLWRSKTPGEGDAKLLYARGEAGQRGQDPPGFTEILITVRWEDRRKHPPRGDHRRDQHMEDKTLKKQASNEVLKKIVEYSPKIGTTKGIVDLAAYALLPPWSPAARRPRLPTSR